MHACIHSVVTATAESGPIPESSVQCPQPTTGSRVLCAAQWPTPGPRPSSQRRCKPRQKYCGIHAHQGPAHKEAGAQEDTNRSWPTSTPMPSSQRRRCKRRQTYRGLHAHQLQDQHAWRQSGPPAPGHPGTSQPTRSRKQQNHESRGVCLRLGAHGRAQAPTRSHQEQ